MALINGRTYDWDMITMKFSNLMGEVYGVTKISYEKNRKVETHYGRGSNPISKGHGNVSYTASITLDMDVVEEIRAQSPNNDLTENGLFDVSVTFNHPTDGYTVIHTLKDCEFSQEGVDVSQDDTRILQEFNLNPGFIEFADTDLISSL